MDANLKEYVDLIYLIVATKEDDPLKNLKNQLGEFGLKMIMRKLFGEDQPEQVTKTELLSKVIDKCNEISPDFSDRLSDWVGLRVG